MLPDIRYSTAAGREGGHAWSHVGMYRDDAWRSVLCEYAMVEVEEESSSPPFRI